MAEEEKTVSANEAEEVKSEEVKKEAPADEKAPKAKKAPKVKAEDKLKAELKEQNDKYLRLAAEYDNFRKRTAKEKEMLFGDAAAMTLAEFLSVYDNLERAIANPTTDENYKKGVELIFSEFVNVLGKMKVEIISPKGEKFDPNYHNAVMQEVNEEFPENTVSEVFQKGFKLGERVIRPAVVKVANC